MARRPLSSVELDYLDRERVCRVASADAQGRPHVAPFCHALDRESQTLYVYTGPLAKTARNLMERPWARVLCDTYEEDWSRLVGVAASGPGRALTEGEELAHAERLLQAKFPQYRRDRIDFVLAFRLQDVASWGL